MRIIEVQNRDKKLINQLLNVWESSVKATHLFLSADEINCIKEYVPEALENVSILVIAENDAGNPVGFMGIADQKLEMLFVSNENRGRGVGTKLLQYGIDQYPVNRLAVNEQNRPFALTKTPRHIDVEFLSVDIHIGELSQLLTFIVDDVHDVNSFSILINSVVDIKVPCNDFSNTTRVPRFVIDRLYPAGHF